MSNAASEAAAGLAPELAAELLGQLAPSELAESDQLVQEVAVAAGGTPSSQETAVAQVAQETVEDEEFRMPEYSLVEFEDDEDEDLLAPAAEVEDEELLDEYEDQDNLRSRLAAAEKKAKFYEEQAVESKLGQWKKKYKGMYPLANVEEISATSRRAFEKAAVKSHNANYRLLEPELDRLKKAYETVLGAATTEGRAAAAAAFGKPTAGPGIVPLEASAQTEDLVAARKSGDLRKVIGVLFKQGQ